MKEFIFTSNQFIGYMKFGYDSEGVLAKFENNAILETQHQVYLSKNFPFAQSDLLKIVGKGKLEDCTDLTFDRFWKEYGYKKDRDQAEKHWRKMSDEEKAKAISSIKRYKHDCRMHNRDIIYAVRYLKNRRYMDE
ncbi:MAG: hypothetical protein QM500_15510 [Methylococcales bacterium]